MGDSAEGNSHPLVIRIFECKAQVGAAERLGQFDVARKQGLLTRNA